MNSQLLIDAIQSNNDLSTIASIVGCSDADLKQYLIQLIESTAESSSFVDLTPPMVSSVRQISKESTKSIEEYDSDNDEDQYDQIIRTAPFDFTDEQLYFMQVVAKEHKSVALLAPAGYGKSACIKTVIKLLDITIKPYSLKMLRERYGNFESICSPIGLCASTGKAASLIGGRTLHSFLGIGIGRGTVKEWVKRLKTARFLDQALHDIRALQVLIIDEISMISAQLLDMISDYLQQVRKNLSPFGGVQLILVGDIAQLPPVSKGSLFFFESKEYIAAKVRKVVFTKCFRQSDPALLKALNEIRYGECSDDTFKLFASQTSIDEEYSQGLQPTRLLATNSEVDAVNDRELSKMIIADNSRIKVYSIKAVNCLDEKRVEAYRKSDNIPKEVKLAVGVQVMITHNLNNVLINGTQGTVIELLESEVKLKLLNGNIVNIQYFGYKDPEWNDIYDAKTIFHYLPLRLCYAMSIHKSQGCSIQLLEVDCKKIFCHGQAYTALSRCIDLRGLIVKNFNRSAIICDPKVKYFCI